jgi:taurine dioxygenase
MLNAEISTRPAPAAAFEVIPTGAALGAEVGAGDLRTLDHAGFARVLEAWRAHAVVLFRNQAVSDHDLIAFSRRFGDLDWAPVQENGRRFVEGMPEIYIVSNVKVNGEAIGSLGDGEAVWHTDMSYLDVPPKASMLYALEIPPHGGNTSFCCMYSVYEGLPAVLKARIEGLRIKHDGHLQQRRLCAPGRDAHRRPPHLSGGAASAGVHPSRHRTAHALSRAPPQRLPRRTRS